MADISGDSPGLAPSQQPYQGLSPEVILDALDSQGFLCDGRLLALNSYENRVYQVGQEHGPPLVAKFYRPHRWRDEQILEEHQFSHFLVERDLPVVAPLRNDDGESLFHFRDFRFAVFTRAGGHAPELDNDNHLLMLGRTLARWHACGSDRPYQVRPTLDIIGDIRRAWDILSKDVVDLNYQGAYRDLVGAILDTLTTHLAGRNTPLINVHGDCHGGNMLWRDDRPHFVDLDDSLRAPAMQDLWMLLSGERDEETQQLNVLAQGYEQFLPFPWDQRALIIPLRLRRLICHSAWIANRWNDPAFPNAFPWFDSSGYWRDQITVLQQQHQLLQQHG